MRAKCCAASGAGFAVLPSGSTSSNVRPLITSGRGTCSACVGSYILQVHHTRKYRYVVQHACVEGVADSGKESLLAQTENPSEALIGVSVSCWNLLNSSHGHASNLNGMLLYVVHDLLHAFWVPCMLRCMGARR